MGSERESKNYRQPWITGFLDEWYRPGSQFAALTLAELGCFFERSDYLRYILLSLMRLAGFGNMRVAYLQWIQLF